MAAGLRIIFPRNSQLREIADAHLTWRLGKCVTATQAGAHRRYKLLRCRQSFQNANHGMTLTQVM